MEKEEIVQKINLLHPTLKVWDVTNRYATVENKYGLCKLQIYSLFNGSKPTINTAIDKTEYFINQLREKQPNLIVTGTYIGALNRIEVKDNYGLCSSTPNRLL